ncbi:hypothetical protein P8452_70763 [Trifolium repens]|jgi:hypothetical protein|nr:hypothetical protein P8452_70763 [Trifolium repens]
MEFYIPVKEIKRVTLSNGGCKGSGKDTTAVAGWNPPVAKFYSGRCFRWCWFSVVLNLVTGGFESCHCFSGNFEGR